MGENDTYQVLKQMADNMVQINKHITPKEWEEAQERVRNLAREGRRIDGAPATASIYGIMPRKATAAAVATGGMSEAEKAQARKALLAEIERMRSDETGRNAEAADRGEPEGDAGKAHPQAGADGVPEATAGGDRKRGNADRGDQAAPAGSGTARKHRKKEGTRDRRNASCKLTLEQEEALFEEYCSTTATYPELAQKYGIGQTSLKRYLGRQRKIALSEGRELADKPKRKIVPQRKRLLRLTPEQAQEILRRRKAGEKTPDIAAEYGVTKWILNDEIYRQIGKTKSGHRVLTEDEKVQIVTEYVNGERAKATCKKWSIGADTLRKLVAEAGYKMRKPGFTQKMDVSIGKIEYPRLAEWMRTSGTSLQDLAEKTDASYANMRGWIYGGCGRSLPKFVIDALIEMTGMRYEILFERGMENAERQTDGCAEVRDL